MAFDGDETKITIPIHGNMVAMTIPEARRVLGRLAEIFNTEEKTPEEDILIHQRRHSDANWG